MKKRLALNLIILLVISGPVHADDAEKNFDGTWDTTLSCENSNGALGYSFQFPSNVAQYMLHGEKGTKGQAGWLQIDGKVHADGTARLYVYGLVGAAPYAVGQRPEGTEYSYHVEATFTATEGAGKRVEGRPCTVTFAKKS